MIRLMAGKKAYLDHLARSRCSRAWAHVTCSGSPGDRRGSACRRARRSSTRARRVARPSSSSTGRPRCAATAGRSPPSARGPSWASSRCSITARAPRRSPATPTARCSCIESRCVCGHHRRRARLGAQAARHPGRPHPRARPGVVRLSRPGGRRPSGRSPVATTFAPAMTSHAPPLHRPSRHGSRPTGSGPTTSSSASGCWSPPSPRCPGCLPQITDWHDDSEVIPGRVRRHPRRPAALLLHGDAGADRLGRASPSRRGCATGSGALPTAGPPRRRTSSAGWPTSERASTCRRCCATLPPESCTR